MNTQDNSTLVFKAIHSFVMALSQEFGTKNKPLTLYARLIEQTTFSHNVAIQKHIQAFTKFCVQNREAIYDKKYECLSFPRIKYSDRVYIDMKDIFKIASSEEKNIIWQHILTISALVDGTGKAKKILKETLEHKTTESNEANFLTDIIEKVEKNIDIESLNQADPMQAIGQIMSSGIFTDLISSMNDQVSTGKLDMTKMLGVVQNMVGTLSKDDPNIGQMVSGLLQSLPDSNVLPTNNSQTDSQQPQ
jgi:hypothetical protein